MVAFVELASQGHSRQEASRAHWTTGRHGGQDAGMNAPTLPKQARHLGRRDLLSAVLAIFLRGNGVAAATGPLKFGLTPVFLNNDIDLLAKLKSYLSRQTGQEVQLVQRRTYEEITALLL